MRPIFLLNFIFCLTFCLTLLQGCSYLRNFFSFNSSTDSDDLSSREIENLIIGWKEMIQEIEKSTPYTWSHREQSFRLELKLPGEWELSIFPEKAFTLRKLQQGLYMATISNPQFLYEQTGGVLKRTYIQARLSKIGGDKGKVDLAPHMECLYAVTFYQKNGHILDFKKAKKRYRYDFLFSPLQVANVHSLQNESVLFKRELGRFDKATVTLKLVDKKTGEVYQGQPIPLPNCALSMEPKGHHAIPMERTPGQCLVHVQGGPRVFLETSLDFHSNEVWANNCSYPIRCQLPLRYGLSHHGKIVAVKERSLNFSLAPQSASTVDTGYTWDDPVPVFDKKVYTVSLLDKTSLPDGKGVTINEDFLDCEWDAVD